MLDALFQKLKASPVDPNPNPRIRTTEVTDPDPDPALFVGGFQDINKSFFSLFSLHQSSKIIKSHTEVTKLPVPAAYI